MDLLRDNQWVRRLWGTNISYDVFVLKKLRTHRLERRGLSLPTLYQIGR